MTSFDWAPDREEAIKRAKKYVNRDPFPHIPRALLSKEHIVEYAAKTGMIYPASSLHGPKWDESDTLKTASYEARAGYRIINYNDKGEMITIQLEPNNHGMIALPPNSIVFVSTEDEFFLPNYIAMRFNLRIKHVHRGLLLGTGPLVDPGYDKRILIPLHNLTDSPYHISTDEGLIWVEFTKTSALYKNESTAAPESDLAFKHALPKTTKKELEEYLFKANGGFPIRSSIPRAVIEAQRSAKVAERRAKTLQTVGLVALVSLAIGIASVFLSVLSLVSDTQAQLHSMEQRVGQLEATRRTRE